MVGRYDLGGDAAPPLSATRLVRQGLPDDGKGRAFRSDFLNSAACPRQPLPGPGIWRGPVWGASSEAYLGPGELVTRPDVHVIHRIRWPQPVVVTFSRRAGSSKAWRPGRIAPASTPGATDQPVFRPAPRRSAPSVWPAQAGQDLRALNLNGRQGGRVEPQEGEDRRRDLGG